MHHRPLIPAALLALALAVWPVRPGGAQPSASPLASQPGAAPPAASTRPAPLIGADTFQYILGTQTFDPRYGLTRQPRLHETACAIADMGSNVIKFSLLRRHWTDAGLTTKEPSLGCLVDVARHDAYRRVLEMPFAHILLWSYALADTQWHDGLTQPEREQEYQEVYDLAAHLLTAYSGTGRTFYLGHWEGDWHLHHNFDPNNEPSEKKLAGMIDWLNIRQKAVDDARRRTPHRDVRIFHYTEVNLVQKGLKGGRCLTNDVLPHVRVDYVSYSCYDSLKGDIRKNLHAALDHVQSKLAPRDDLPGRRVFIGEYGFPLLHVKTPQEQERLCRQVMRAAIEWGCPLALYWQMYCNESAPSGGCKGFWLIDSEGRKQPVFVTHQQFLREARRYVEEAIRRTGRPPATEDFRTRALEWLKE